VRCVDEGLPIAYEVLEKGVPVLACDGEQVGTVHHVVAAPEQDIFHGLVITVPSRGRRFDEDPGELKGWHHWVNVMTLRGDWRRGS